MPTRFVALLGMEFRFLPVYVLMKHHWDLSALFPRRDILDKCKQLNLGAPGMLKLKIMVYNKFSINQKVGVPECYTELK